MLKPLLNGMRKRRNCKFVGEVSDERALEREVSVEV